MRKDLNHICRSVRALRGDMTQSEFADLVGVQKAYVSLCENGRRTPKIETVQEWAKAVGVQVVFSFDLRKIGGAPLGHAPS